MSRIIVAGGRYFDDYFRLKSFLETTCIAVGDIILSGCCPTGADALGERYANEEGHEIEYFPADWKMYPKAAGPMRNRQMAKAGDVLVAFWDGSSRGTRSMINEALTHRLQIHVDMYGRE